MIFSYQDQVVDIELLHTDFTLLKLLYTAQIIC